MTLSSDWDVSMLNPFVGMQNALTRKPQQLPDVAAAIKAYTLTPAYALRQEEITGSIEVGKQADLIVLDRNLLEAPLNQISKTTVLETYLAGERVYVAERMALLLFGIQSIASEEPLVNCYDDCFPASRVPHQSVLPLTSRSLVPHHISFPVA